MNFSKDIYVTIEDVGEDGDYDEIPIVHALPEEAAVVNGKIQVAHYVLENILTVESELKTTVS